MSSVPATGTASNWTLGAFMGGGTTFRGSIGDVRLYNRALSLTEVSGLFAEGQPN